MKKIQKSPYFKNTNIKILNSDIFNTKLDKIEERMRELEVK